VRKAFKQQTAQKKDVALGLALQGGGSYGAFTKGALKALLEEGIITADNLKAVSGTSAGAKNGALLVDGLTSGTPQSTIAKLDRYWGGIGKTWDSNAKSPLVVFNPFIPTAVTNDSYPNLTREFQRAALRMSPPSGYMFREMQKHLKKNITSWRALQSSPIKLFVNAVKENPATGERKQHIFTGSTLNVGTVPLSANLREFGAARYRGRDYYDGAYWRNPCFDGVLAANITDLLVITIQPKSERAITPINQDDARQSFPRPGHQILTKEIHNHMAWLANKNPALNLHEISLDVMPHWDSSSRMNAHPQWLEELSDMGYKAAKQWIKDNGALLGTSSSYKTKYDASNNNQKPEDKKRLAPN
jgi:NTE family protein